METRVGAMEVVMTTMKQEIMDVEITLILEIITSHLLTLAQWKVEPGGSRNVGVPHGGGNYDQEAGEEERIMLDGASTGHLFFAMGFTV